MTRQAGVRWTVGAVLAVLATVLPSGPGLRAQAASAPPPADAKALQALQAQLEQARKERLALEARLERQTAEGVAARAKSLAMGGEVGALQRLELLLDSAQVRLLLQRDRLRMLQEPTEAAQRADKLSAPDSLPMRATLKRAP